MRKKLKDKILMAVLFLAVALWPMTAQADVVMGPEINAGNVMIAFLVIPVAAVVVITLIILKNTKKKDEEEGRKR